MVVTSVGIVGGTGPLGRGLAGRLVLAGLDVVIGSRDPARARDVASEIGSRLPEGAGTPSSAAAGDLRGSANDDALDVDAVVITLPAAGLDSSLPPLAPALEGRLVVCTVNPLAFDDEGPHTPPLPDGSAAATVARHLPGARVTAAFHTVSSHHLLRFADPMDDDVPVVGDDADAVDAVVGLVDRVPGLRGVAAGPLRLAAALEALTPILVTVNRRARRHVGIRFSRLPDGRP